MDWISAVEKLGITAAVTIILLFIIYYVLRWLLEKVNELIEDGRKKDEDYVTLATNHINHSTEAINKLTEAIDRLCRRLEK